MTALATSPTALAFPLDPAQATEEHFNVTIQGSLHWQERVTTLAQDLQQRLDALVHKLIPLLEAEAPEQADILANRQAKVETTGYGKLPSVTKDTRAPLPETISPRAYTWTHCHGQLQDIEASLKEVEALPGQIQNLSSQEIKDKAAEVVKVRDSLTHTTRHVRYNETWQDHMRQPQWRGFFNKNTELGLFSKAIIDRQDSDLSADEQQLTHEIESKKRLSRIYPKLSKSVSENRILFTLPMITDIQDQEFLDTFVRYVEEIWQGTLGTSSVSLELDLEVITPETLYHPDSPPAHGATINTTDHLERFKQFGKAVLTTGSSSTYCSPDFACILGPAEVSNRVLAHEVGHLIGFVDCYFRGYRLLGEKGFEVFEVEADFADIMCSIGHGSVLPFHFEEMYQKTP